jgi:photosystem II stability/assembly factor-like uncharacterized protein
MKVSLIFVLLFFCGSNVYSQHTWENYADAPYSPRFDDFHFINPDTGWMINPYYTVTPYGRVLHTTDGGRTWEKLLDSSGIYFRSVGFADALTGWIGSIADTANHALILPIDTIPLYQTRDGGHTWQPVQLPQPHIAGVCGISVVTDSVVYAYGRYSSPAGYMKTTDKGATWAFVSLDSLAFGIIDGRFFGPDTGFLTGMGTDRRAIILYTYNGGASWKACYHSAREDSDRVWKIFFPSRKTGYASIEYAGKRRKNNCVLLKTVDGGTSWQELDFVPGYNEEGIGFINDSTGWIGGDADQCTYMTRDGGATWLCDETFGITMPSVTPTRTGFAINRFRSFGDTLLYASGNTFYRLHQPHVAVPERYEIFNYPNPFSGSTTISLSLPEGVKGLQLTVTDMIGRQVLRRSLGDLKQGFHPVELSADLRNGLYLYTVTNGYYKFTGHMQVMK